MADLLLLPPRKKAPLVDLSFLYDLPAGYNYSRASSETRYNALGLNESVATNLPPFDYDPVTLLPRGLRMAPQRQNYLPYSVPDGVNYSYISASYSVNAATAPDGTLAMLALTDNASSTTHYIAPSATISFVSGTIYVASLHVRAGTATALQIALPSAQFSSFPYANFNLTNGTVGTNGGLIAYGIVPLGGGVYRIWIAANCTTSGSGVVTTFMNNSNASAVRSPSYAGSSQTLYLWGFQCEAGSFPTSYIPTNGASLSRAVSSLYTTNLAWYNPNQGTVLVDFMLDGLQTGYFPQPFELSDGTINTKIFTYCNGTTGQFALKAYNSGTGLFDIGGGSLAAYTSYKGGGSYSSVSGYVRALNGTTQSSGITTIPSGINRLQLFGGVSNPAFTPSGWLRRFRYWNRALSQNEIAQLTAA